MRRATPEEEARRFIDAGREKAGWVVQDRDEMNLAAGRGVAVREFRLAQGHGFADYLLFVDEKAVGALEAKPMGFTLKGVEVQSTALLHHVYDVERLRAAYLALKREAAPGIDGETWRHYGESLGQNLQDLSGGLRRGAYRAKPVRRAYIPKADGRQTRSGVCPGPAFAGGQFWGRSPPPEESPSG